MADKEVDPDEETIATDLVVTKYKMAAEITNDTLKKVIAACVAGATVVALCDLGDKLLNEETAKVFKKEKDMKKGIAFPTCVSIDHCICHFSPLRSEKEIVIKDGDMVKIDLGAHIDGYSAVCAHTFIVGASKDNKVTGRKGDVLVAAYKAAEVALRLCKPGNENNQVTDAIQKVAESYKCKPIGGMLSHQLRHHIIDGEKAIIQNPTEAQRMEHEKCEFEGNEVYGIDVLVSTGEGKGREMDARATVFKRRDVLYNLKMKASRQFFSEVDKKFHTMPFTLRMMEDEKKAKMGVVECVKHELIEPFAVLWERDTEFVAQFKFTVLLMPNGPMKITGLPFQSDVYSSEYNVEDDDLRKLLAVSANRKAVKKKKRRADKQVAEVTAGIATGGIVPPPAAAATTQA